MSRRPPTIHELARQLGDTAAELRAHGPHTENVLKDLAAPDIYPSDTTFERVTSHNTGSSTESRAQHRRPQGRELAQWYKALADTEAAVEAVRNLLVTYAAQAIARPQDNTLCQLVITNGTDDPYRCQGTIAPATSRCSRCDRPTSTKQCSDCHAIVNKPEPFKAGRCLKCYNADHYAKSKARV